MKTIIELFILTIIVCYFEDVSGFVDSLKRFYLSRVFRMRNPDARLVNVPPFDCSRCMTFWACTIWLLCTEAFTLPYILLSCILSMIASNISGFLLLFKDMLSWLEMKIQKLIL